MEKRKRLLPSLVFFLVVTLLLFALSRTGVGKGIQGAFSLLTNFPFSSKPSEITKLKQENAQLISKLATLKAIEKDNSALKDQFVLQKDLPQKLLPAKVIGMPSF